MVPSRCPPPGGVMETLTFCPQLDPHRRAQQLPWSSYQTTPPGDFTWDINEES
jgi:hypothetical protein